MLATENGESGQDALSKLERWLAPYGIPLPDVVPLFADLLSIPIQDRYPPQQGPPQMRRQKLMKALLAVIAKRVSQQPVLIVVEDLHWVDPSTLEFLTAVLDQVPAGRLMVLLTFRPTYAAPWSRRSYMTTMTLGRLPGELAQAIILDTADGKTIPSEVQQQIVERADGVPLFIEELTKMVIESGLLEETERGYELTGSLPLLAIPSTLQDSLTARLDRLATAKEVAQLGAMLGREFRYDLLSAISQLGDTALQRELSRLVDAELLYQRGLPPSASFIFKHALVQETAYASMLRSRRHQLHLRIAHTLKNQYGERASRQPEVVAHHYTEAGLADEAISYWRKAGEISVSRSAFQEAIRQLEKGLELLKTLPATSDRDRLELSLMKLLGPALLVKAGFGTIEAKQAYERMLELGRIAGEREEELFPTVFGMWVRVFSSGEVEAAKRLEKQLFEMAGRSDDPGLLLEAHHASWSTGLFHGSALETSEHLEGGIALYRPKEHHGHVKMHGHDPGVCAFTMSALNLWLLGYPEKSVVRVHEAAELAEQLKHPFSVLFPAWAKMLLANLSRDVSEAVKYAEKIDVLSMELGTGAFFLPHAASIQGAYSLREGHLRDGLSIGTNAIAQLERIGFHLLRPALVASLLEGCLFGDHVEAGIELMAAELASETFTGQKLLEPEVRRLHGELLLRDHDGARSAEAEVEIRLAMDIAQKQQCRSLELRAALSLCRLQKDKVKKVSARKILAPIYDSFTEGFDTADLIDAKVMIEEVS